MIVVIANTETDEFTGVRSLVTSHGIDTDTDQILTLPNIHPGFLGAKFDEEIGEYVIR